MGRRRLSSGGVPGGLGAPPASADDPLRNHPQLLPQGDTAVYLLYAHARIASIVRKAGKDIAAVARTATITLGNEHERALALHVSRFGGESPWEGHWV